MNKQRKTSHILNVFQYDADGHVVLPASLTLGIVPGAEDNSGKVPSTAWVRGLVSTTGSSLVPTSRSITINGTSYDLSSNRSWSIDTGVLTASAGSGISVSVVNQNLNIVNTGLLTGTAGAGISVSTVNQNLNIVNTGLLTGTAGAGISVSTVNQNLNIVNTGLLTASSGLGISVSTVGQNLNIVNTGILTASAGSGISVSVVGQNLNIVNSGILTATAGAGISLSVVDGNLNIVNTITNNNQLTNGAGYATTSYVTTQINNLVAGAPGLLDTLDELAAALGDDANFATTTATSLGNRLRIDIGTQGLTSTQQGYGRANLGLGTAALSATGDFATAAQGTKADTAFGWGNHASAGYLTTSSAASTYVSLTGSYANPSWITSLAYSKITGVPAFLTSYTETDTLATVTSRGNTTSNSVRFGSHVDLSPTGSAFRFYDGSTFRGGFGTDAWGHGGSDANLVLYVNGDNTLFFSTSGTKRASLSSSAFNSLVAIQQNGNQVLHAGNYTSYTYSTSDADNRFLRGTTNPGSVNNFTISIGNNGSYSYVQSHSGQPLRLNPVGNTIYLDATTYAGSNLYANIIYDQNNSGYYLDPDSTSNVNAITMAGTLFMNGGAYYGTILFGGSSYWRAGISQRDAGNAELRIWAKGGGAGSIYFATGYDGESSSTALPTDGMALKNNKLGIGSWGVSEFPSYKLHVKGDIYANGGWLRASGEAGIYFESYGGGWRMTGSSYIESYGSKSLHMQGASVDYVGSLYFSGAGHIQPNSGSYGALQMTSNKNGWAGIRFTEYNTNLMSNSTTSGFHHNDYGWQFKWESGNAYVYSGTYGGGSAYTVYHSGNLNPITTSNIGSQSVSYASNSGTVGSIGVSTLRGGISSNNYDFYVNGDANTYYPVVLSLGGQYGMHRYSISRGYSDPAPWDPIGTGSHRGGLTLTFDASSDIAWGGNDKSWRIIQFAEQYTNMVAGMALPVTDGIIVWLRGGGAYYRFHGPSGINHSATVYYSGYSAANGAVYYTRTNLNNVDSEIRAKWPIRGYGDGAMYVANNEVLHLGNYISYMDKLYYQGSQRLWTGSDGTRNSGWAYHQDNNTGIHWPNNGWHFYPKDASDMYVRAGSGSNVSLVMNTAGTNRGYVYADSSNQIGFLNNDRNWIFRMTSGGDAYAVSYYSSASTSKYLTSNTSSYTTWYVGGNNNGYSGFRVDGGMCLMMHTNGASGPTGFWLNNWSILTYVDSAQYLYHNGNEKFRTDGGGIYVTGTVYATGDVIAYYSDARLKKDVVTIDNAISKIKQLRGVTYIWNDEKVNVAKERAGTKDIGLIAQEVEAVEPLFITEYQSQLNTPSNDPEEAKNFVPEMSETYKTIKYEKLVALLVEGMKEQQLQIEELQNKLDNVLSSR